jgi:hypothetical protein
MSTIYTILSEIQACIEGITPVTAGEDFLGCHDIDDDASDRNFDMRIPDENPAEMPDGQIHLADSKYVNKSLFQVRVKYIKDMNPIADKARMAEDGTSIRRALLVYDFTGAYQNGKPIWDNSSTEELIESYTVTHTFNISYQEA